MKITIRLNPSLSVLKNQIKSMPIASQSAIEKVLHQLESLTSVDDERTLSDTGVLLIRVETGDVILFTREEKEVWFNRQRIISVNIIKITPWDYFERIMMEDLLKDPENLALFLLSSAESSHLAELTKSAISSVDNAGRLDISWKLLTKVVSFLGGLLIFLFIR